MLLNFIIQVVSVIKCQIFSQHNSTKDPDYKNAEEKRVITGSEQKTAKKLGEIKEGQVTRKDHGGTPIETKGPTSTEPKMGVTITAPASKSSKTDEKKP